MAVYILANVVIDIDLQFHSCIICHDRVIDVPNCERPVRPRLWVRLRVGHARTGHRPDGRLRSGATSVRSVDFSPFLAYALILLSEGLVTEVTPHLLTPPVSGLMGFGWDQIATSGAKPFWQALAETPGTLDEPVMGFQLTRYLNDARAKVLEPGGTFTLGAVNTTLFEGEIDYQPIPDGQIGYWLLEMTGRFLVLRSRLKSRSARINERTFLYRL